MKSILKNDAMIDLKYRKVFYLYSFYNNKITNNNIRYNKVVYL